MKNSFLHVFRIISVVLLASQSSFGQLTITPNQTGAQLLDYITGTNVTVSNAILNCPNGASGLFQVVGSSNLNLDSGIVLTTGNASTVGTAAGVDGAASLFATTAHGAAGDADLTATIGAQTYDGCRLDFDFVSTFDTVLFYYVFGSEEYPSFTCSPFNDAFAFYISGPGITGNQNMALVPGTNIPVAINSINGGIPSGGSLAACNAMGPGSPFTSYFVDNTGGTTVTYDGFTTMLEAKSPVTSGLTYHLAMVIADVSDEIFDSGVFIRGSSFTSKPGSINLVSDLDNKNNVRVGPNPFRDMIKLDIPASILNEQLSVHMLNETGQLVYQFRGPASAINGDLEAQAGQMRSGSYFMNIEVPSKTMKQILRIQKVD